MRSRVLDYFWGFFWGATSSIWCVAAVSYLGATFDEPFYVTHGLEFWRTGSHSGLLKKGTMPLPVDLQTLPLYLWELWRGVKFDPASELEWMLPWARAGTLVFWWLLLGYGWLAGRQLAGAWGGRLAVALLASEPVMLAHASLATTDIAITACLLALVYHFRTGREGDWIHRVGLPAFWFGVSVLSKASGLVFGALCLLAVELEHLLSTGALQNSNSPLRRSMGIQDLRDRLRPFRHDLVQITVLGLVLVFLYCGTDWRQQPSLVARARSLPNGLLGQSMVWLAENLRIFPNAGEALVRQIKHNIGGHGTYLLGQAHPRAIWYYFPVVLSIKLSLPLLALPLVLAVIRPRVLVNWAMLAAATLLVFSLTFRVQIGVRLVLPLVGFAVVGLAAAVVHACREYTPGWRRFLLALAAAASVSWTASSALAVWPHGLSYVNELWGGTSRGYLYVSDSNYDWGQGLKELTRWQKQQGLSRLDVWYFGTDPAIETLPLRQVPLDSLQIKSIEDLRAHLEGHYLAVSTTLLYGAIWTEAQRKAVALLQAQKPVGRTMTFLIYDLGTGHRGGCQKKS